MEWSLVCNLIDELATWDPQPSITLSYEGESLLHPQIREILSYLQTTPFKPWLSTNLIDADTELLEIILATCGTVNVSLDGPVEVYSKIRGTPSQYGKVVANLNQMMAIRDKMTNPAEVTVSLTVNPPLMPSSPEVGIFVATWRDRVDHVYLWLASDSTQGLKLTFRQGLDNHLAKRRVCHQPFSYVAVLADGRIAPCCNTSRVVLSGINARDGLGDVLESKVMQEFRASHRSIDLAGLYCDNCDLWLEGWLADEEIRLSWNGFSCLGIQEGNAIRISGGCCER